MNYILFEKKGSFQKLEEILGKYSTVILIRALGRESQLNNFFEKEKNTKTQKFEVMYF